MNLDLTDEQVSSLLVTHFQRIDELANAADSAEAWSVESGSSLARDDEISQPFQVSHAVHRQIHIAVDHLHAARLLITGGPEEPGTVADRGALHVYADYTLIRGAIEAASVGLWLLGPATRDVRVGRVLVWSRQDAYDASQAIEESHPDAAEELRQARRDRTSEVAAAADVELPNRRPTFTSIVQEASQRASVTALLSWRICSGMAHGRFWSYQAMSKIEEVKDHGATVTIRSTGTLAGVLVMMTDAISLVDHLVKLLDLRRRQHAH